VKESTLPRGGARPDQQIYVMNGNHTRLRGTWLPTPPQNYQEDFLLPRQWTPTATRLDHGPGGHILRTDPEGKHWNWCSPASVMPTISRSAPRARFSRSTATWSGIGAAVVPSDPGHPRRAGGRVWLRSGSSKWPDYYPDSLPPVVDIGVGCPTGVQFGTKSKFPAVYRDALYVQDWSYGRILASTSNRTGPAHRSLRDVPPGQAFAVTHLEFGTDERCTSSPAARHTIGLYRVAYDGKTPPSPAEGVAALERKGEKARRLRHQLEAFYGKHDPKAFGFAWPCLRDEDRSSGTRPASSWSGRTWPPGRPGAGRKGPRCRLDGPARARPVRPGRRRRPICSTPWRSSRSVPSRRINKPTSSGLWA